MNQKSQAIQLGTRFQEDLTRALDQVKGWGSVEIYVQNGKVTQITSRAIKKTNHSLKTTS